MKTIDADALLVHALPVRGVFDVADEPYIDAVPVAYIKNAPTVVTNPVRLGHWKIRLNRGFCKGDRLECSECGQLVKIEGITKTLMPVTCCRYCPKCGAKMDENGTGGRL